MKRFFNIFFTALLFLGFSYFIAGSYLKDKNTSFAQTFNHYNLMAKRDPKFIKINYDDANEEKDGSYTFYADSYDRQGKYHEIDFHSDDDFDDGQLVQLDTKGSYVKDYQTIIPNDLPYKVFRIFQD